MFSPLLIIPFPSLLHSLYNPSFIFQNPIKKNFFWNLFSQSTTPTADAPRFLVSVPTTPSAYFYHNITALIRLPGKLTAPPPLLLPRCGRLSLPKHAASPCQAEDWQVQILCSTVGSTSPASSRWRDVVQSLVRKSSWLGMANPLQYSVCKPRTEEPGRLHLRGSKSLDDWVTEHTSLWKAYIKGTIGNGEVICNLTCNYKMS